MEEFGQVVQIAMADAVIKLYDGVLGSANVTAKTLEKEKRNCNPNIFREYK